MRRSAALLATAAIAAGLCWLAAVLWSRSAQFLAQTWQNELEQAPDSQVDAVLDRLASLGEESFPALCRALGSDRECVAEGALHALREELTRWKAMPPGEVTRRKRSLVKVLSGQFAEYGPVGRRGAASLVANLLTNPPSLDSPADAECLAACTAMLRAEGATNGHPPLRPVSMATIAAKASQSHGNRQATGPSPESKSQPGDAETDASKQASSSVTASKDAEPKAVPPSKSIKRLPPVASDAASHPLRELLEKPSSPGPDDGTGDSRLAASNAPRRLPPLRRTGFDERVPGSALTGSSDRLANQLREVARMLHDSDSRQSESARSALRQRGFSEAEVELARQLTDPDPSVRKALARAIVSTTGVDAAPWLLELIRDPDADVRLEAMTLLVTTADPALLEQLRPLVQADPDERIQRLASRLSRGNLLSEKSRRGEKMRSRGDSP